MRVRVILCSWIFVREIVKACMCEGTYECGYMHELVYVRMLCVTCAYECVRSGAFVYNMRSSV